MTRASSEKTDRLDRFAAEAEREAEEARMAEIAAKEEAPQRQIDDAWERMSTLHIGRPDADAAGREDDDDARFWGKQALGALSAIEATRALYPDEPDAAKEVGDVASFLCDPSREHEVDWAAVRDAVMRLSNLRDVEVSEEAVKAKEDREPWTVCTRSIASYLHEEASVYELEVEKRDRASRVSPEPSRNGGEPETFIEKCEREFAAARQVEKDEPSRGDFERDM